MLRVHAALFTVALLFSANYVISKLGMRELSPLAFSWLRIAGAAIVLWFLARNEAPLPREDRGNLVLFTILGVVINAPLFLAGLALTSVQVAAILITAIPVFALAAAIVMGHERPTATRIGGIALACAGALLVVGGESFAGTWRSLLGTILILTNCLSYALYLVISKPAMTRLSPRAVVARMFALGTLILLPVSAYSLWTAEWTSVSGGTWVALGVVIAGPTVLAYLLNAWALRHADSSVVAAYTYVQPVLATILGMIFFGEEVRATLILAAVMIFTGVWLAGRASGPIAE
ncbi:MAG TPA: DMT family transporter [Thermoanaerobaculia bacterium]|nr:DMT family transporter [Thermoanaerobaculia bacterium]